MHRSKESLPKSPAYKKKKELYRSHEMLSFRSYVSLNNNFNFKTHLHPPTVIHNNFVFIKVLKFWYIGTHFHTYTMLSTINIYSIIDHANDNMIQALYQWTIISIFKSHFLSKITKCLSKYSPWTWMIFLCIQTNQRQKQNQNDYHIEHTKGYNMFQAILYQQTMISVFETHIHSQSPCVYQNTKFWFKPRDSHDISTHTNIVNKI